MNYDVENLCVRVICHRTFKNGLYVVNNVEIVFVPIMY